MTSSSRDTASGSDDPSKSSESAEPEGLDTLLPVVYGELHRLARHYLRRERPDHTLQTTALVHEAYLRLSKGKDPPWNDRKHFFCIAAKAMRHILLGHARDRGRLKRGGEWRRVSLEEGITVSGKRPTDLLALDAALERLSVQDERLGRIVELRYFGGLSVEETAETLEISPATVKRDWTLAKAWLLDAMSG